MLGTALGSTTNEPCSTGGVMLDLHTEAPAASRPRLRLRPPIDTVNGPPKGSEGEHLDLVAQRDAQAVEVAEQVGVGVEDAHETPLCADRQPVEGDRLGLVDLEVGRGDRVAVRVAGRVSELGGDGLQEPV